MQRVLFHSTIFGPIHSRRLGTSLGVNLSPDDGKVCSFDCLYCEAGFNAQGPGTTGLPPADAVIQRLEDKLRAMKAAGDPLDVITFSGNGEPTMHPDFETVIDGVLELRDRYYPEVKVSVLTNATRLDRPAVVHALQRVDNNILKLDSAVDATVQALDRPVGAYSVSNVIEQMKQFSGTGIIQTMFTRGTHNGIHVDNTTEEEISALIDAYKVIRPASIMIYGVDRTTPEPSMERVDSQWLRNIAQRITAATGIPVTTA